MLLKKQIFTVCLSWCCRNSFFYQRAKKILFVRRERMENIGGFVMVILHSMAHIKIDELTDDTNPLFLREFYKVIFKSVSMD